MANAPLATEYDATIWSHPHAIPAGGTVATATLSTTAGLSFAPTSAAAMVYVFNNSTRTVSVGYSTTTGTSNTKSTYTATIESVTAAARSKAICDLGAGSLGLIGSGAATTVTVIYWNCTQTATT